MTYNVNNKCPKCGGVATTEYKAWHFSTKLEKIRRQCIRCGYTWEEEPLDSGEKLVLFYYRNLEKK